MTMPRIPHVPDAYRAVHLGSATLHVSRGEAGAFVSKLQHWTIGALRFLRDRLAFTPRRQLHVCAYHRSDEARQFLGRTVSATLAMAPYASATDSVVIVHSEALDSRNGDDVRMRRLLTHEVMHQATAEVTGSTKSLGDGNRGMGISTWLNEGMAETAGLLATDAQQRLADTTFCFTAAHEHVTFGELSRILDELDHPARSVAFDHVTAAVFMLSEPAGMDAMLADIPGIDAAFGQEDACSPERLRAYLERRQG